MDYPNATATRDRYYHGVISVEAAPAAVRGAPMEVVAAVILTALFAIALAVIFGITALRDARLR